MNAGIGHGDREPVLARQGLDDADVAGLQLRHQGTHAARRGARRLGEPFVHDEGLTDHRTRFGTLHHCAMTPRCVRGRRRGESGAVPPPVAT